MGDAGGEAFLELLAEEDEEGMIALKVKQMPSIKSLINIKDTIKIWVVLQMLGDFGGEFVQRLNTLLSPILM